MQRKAFLQKKVGEHLAAEKNFENRVKKFLKDRGSYFIKYWGGAAYTKSGVPDILASIDGCFFGIEDKAEKGKPSLLQIVHLEKIRKSGGYGVLLYPKDFEQFKAWVEHKSRDHPWYVGNVELQKQWKQRLEKE